MLTTTSRNNRATNVAIEIAKQNGKANAVAQGNGGIYIHHENHGSVERYLTPESYMSDSLIDNNEMILRWCCWADVMSKDYAASMLEQLMQRANNVLLEMGIPQIKKVEPRQGKGVIVSFDYSYGKIEDSVTTMLEQMNVLNKIYANRFLDEVIAVVENEKSLLAK